MVHQPGYLGRYPTESAVLHMGNHTGGTQSPPAARAYRFWFAAFFVTGATIGTFVAVALLDQGASWPIALFAGSVAGGYGAWFLLLALLRLASIFGRGLSTLGSRSDDA
ncbi:MAG: hypothetical protein HKN47_18675 [Pirellulaceae bacterium]|nr:hypothetical protein [Pirellulaceae bacterium]